MAHEFKAWTKEDYGRAADPVPLVVEYWTRAQQWNLPPDELAGGSLRFVVRCRVWRGL
jgi:hypothetical protein